MERLFFPAIFHRAEEGGFWVTFPDIPECMTQGEDMKQSYEMAVDALGLSISSMMEAGEKIPEASEPDAIKAEEGGCLMVVEIDMYEYWRKSRSRAVKKTLSIPEWMNNEATRRGIKFSQTLQEALLSKLNAN